jgi:prevent-host-death family protein
MIDINRVWRVNMKSVTALEARKRFGGVLDEVAEKGSHILISRLNRPLAVLVPYEDYQRYMDHTARKRKLLLVAQKMDVQRERLREKMKGIDTTTLIREMRASE